MYPPANKQLSHPLHNQMAPNYYMHQGHPQNSYEQYQYGGYGQMQNQFRQPNDYQGYPPEYNYGGYEGYEGYEGRMGSS